MRYISVEVDGMIDQVPIRHGKMVSEYCDYNIWSLIRKGIAGISGSDH